MHLTQPNLTRNWRASPPPHTSKCLIKPNSKNISIFQKKSKSNTL